MVVFYEYGSFVVVNFVFVEVGGVGDYEQLVVVYIDFGQLICFQCIFDGQWVQIIGFLQGVQFVFFWVSDVDLDEF